MCVCVCVDGERALHCQPEANVTLQFTNHRRILIGDCFADVGDSIQSESVPQVGFDAGTCRPTSIPGDHSPIGIGDKLPSISVT